MWATWFRRLGGVNLGRLAADRKKALSPALFQTERPREAAPTAINPYLQRIGLDVRQPLPVLAQVMGAPAAMVGVRTSVAVATVVAVGVTVMTPSATATEATWVVAVVAGTPSKPELQPVRVPASWAQVATAVL